MPSVSQRAGARQRPGEPHGPKGPRGLGVSIGVCFGSRLLSFPSTVSLFASSSMMAGSNGPPHHPVPVPLSHFHGTRGGLDFEVPTAGVSRPDVPLNGCRDVADERTREVPMGPGLSLVSTSLRRRREEIDTGQRRLAASTLTSCPLSRKRAPSSREEAALVEPPGGRSRPHSWWCFRVRSVVEESSTGNSLLNEGSRLRISRKT